MTDSLPAGPERSAALRRILPRAALLLLFVVILAAAGVVAGVVLQSRVEERRALAQQEVARHLEVLGVRLNETMGAAYLMAGAIIQDQGRNSSLLLNSMAPLLLQQFPVAAAIQLAPKGVIRYSYPLSGNEEAIDHDLLVDPARNREAHLAVATRKLTLAGPFSLVQGGVGVVARFPVYINNADGWPKFWGFTTALIAVPRLLEAAGVMDLPRNGYRYTICRVRDENGCEVFAARGDAPPIDPVMGTLAVPNGEWILAVSPEEGWWRPTEIAAAVVLSLVFAGILTALIVFLSLRIVEMRETREIGDD